MSTELSDLNAPLITLAGPVTLYESSGVRELFLSAISEGRDLTIDLGASGPWDLSGLQLLVSATASAKKLGLSVRLAHVPGVCREVAERSGLARWLAEATESAA